MSPVDIVVVIVAALAVVGSLLYANKRVAAWVNKQRKGGVPPFVYRVHDLPDPEKVEQLRALEMGMTIVAGVVADFPKGVDGPADLEAARRALASAP